jgi:integrase
VLGGALRDAERDGIVVKNVCKIQKAPKVPETEMVIVQDVPAFIARIAGARLYVPAVVALCTGLRLGELLALRDRRLDLDRKVMEVAEALEETKAKGIVFKTPKSKAGRRKLTLPDIAVDALREHRKQLLELRMKLALGKLGPDDLLFPNLDGGPQRPSSVSSDWGELAERIGMPEITFHSLRHSHVSQLIASGVDIVTISKRLGHAKPSVTLAIYSHMFHTDDRKAGDRDQCSLGRVIGWQSGGNRVAKNHFCSAAIATKLLKDKSWRGGRVAEGGGLLNRYTV